MARLTLKILSVLVIVMGILMFMPVLTWAQGPVWYGLVKIIIGVIAFAVAFSSRG